MLRPPPGVLFLAAFLPAACSARGRSDVKSPEQREFSLFITTDLMGTIEPCGCTTDPMGDLARTVELVQRARTGKDSSVLFLDGGSLLYTALKLPERSVAQEELKAELLARVVVSDLQAAGIGLGPYDLARGPGRVRPPRQAANVATSSGVPLDPPKIVEAGGVKVGIFGLVSPALVKSAGITAADPVAAAQKAVAELRQSGARVLVALLYMARPQVVDLVRAVDGIDFAVVGQTVPGSKLTIQHEPTQVKNTWLIEPTERGQVVARVDLTVRGEGAFTDAIGEGRAAVAVLELDERLAKLRTDLAAWEKDPTSDKGFLAEKKKEVAELESERKTLLARPLAIPDKGPWFTLTQVLIKKKLACNKKVQEEKQSFDVAAGKANRAAAAKLPSPPVPAGLATYVGVDECANCHGDEVEFWEKTRHHQAWNTLVEVKKEFNLDCISCHVTGWDRPGGSTLAHNEGLRDVQCEVCHGPGSRHVEAGGNEKPRSVVKSPDEKVCIGCHTPEHSDTFQLIPYSRDVVGKGHGEAKRKNLGPGPTGHELRHAGLERAGKELGEGCVR
jgi:hypothetical protein